MDIYRDYILDHYKNPRNFGTLKKADSSVTKSNTSCGDSVQIHVQMDKNKKSKQIKDIRFSGVGCAISQASASMLTEFAKGKSDTQIHSFTTETVLELLNVKLTPSRIKCATLSLEALQEAVKKG